MPTARKTWWSRIARPTTYLVLLGNGDGTFQAAVNYAVGSGPTFVAAAADFNGNGAIDLVTCKCELKRLVDPPGQWLTVTFSPAVSYLAGNMPFFVVAGDWNGNSTVGSCGGESRY